MGVIFFLLLSRSLGSSLGGQIWKRAPLLTEPFHWPNIIILYLVDFKDFVFLKVGICWEGLKEYGPTGKVLGGKDTGAGKQEVFGEQLKGTGSLESVILKYSPETQPPPLPLNSILQTTAHM